MSSENNKIPSSMSTPEFTQQNVDNCNENDLETKLATNQNENEQQEQQEQKQKQRIIKSNTMTNAANTITKTRTSITFNSTRDSGFSDSITEDISSSMATTSSSTNTAGIIQHSLNVNPDSQTPDITLLTKYYSNSPNRKLKSVEEDIDIICPNGEQDKNGLIDDANKNFVTVVQTTKVTTKLDKKSNEKWEPTP